MEIPFLKKNSAPGPLLASLLLAIIVPCGFTSCGSDNGTAEGEKSKVYQPGNVWIYLGRFYDASGKETRRDTFQLRTFHDRFLLFQGKVMWFLKKGNTTVEETTGIVENGEKLWLHPPRFDDYVAFTEYSAFPEIRKPVVPGDTWKSHFRLASFATKESGPDLFMDYSVTSSETLHDRRHTRSVINGRGTSLLGTITNLMHFHDSLGFTRLEYTRPTGERLVIVLLGMQSLR